MPRPGYPPLAERVWLAPSDAKAPASIRARQDQIEEELARCRAWLTGRRVRTGAIHGDKGEDDFDRGRAPEFVALYSETGGVVAAPIEDLIPLIRCRLVLEVTRAIRLGAPHADWDYTLHLLRSLENLG